MKKLLILSIACTASLSFAQYSVVIDQNENNYISRTYTDTGNITCDNYSNIEEDFYKDTEFTQYGTNCTKEQVDEYGVSKWVGIADQTEIKTGTVVLNSCQDILDNNYSRGNDIYTVNFNGSENDVYCNMTLDNGGWMLAGVMANDSNNYWT